MLLLLAITIGLATSEYLSAVRDLEKDWTTIVSDGHLLEAFCTFGQLHILVPEAAAKSDKYDINLHEYYMDSDASLFYAMTEYSTLAGSLTWYLDSVSDTWKISINGCEQDFDATPTKTNDEYHWVLLLTNGMFYLKCNFVVVATMNDAECNYQTWGGENTIFLNVGGWELLEMKGVKVRFESIRHLNQCTRNSMYYKEAGLLGSKPLRTGLDCLYDCKYTTDCLTIMINMTENMCYLYNSGGGKPKYIDMSSRNNKAYMNISPLITSHINCFDFIDDPCWKRNAYIHYKPLPWALTGSMVIKDVSECFMEEKPLTGLFSYWFRYGMMAWDAGIDSCGLYLDVLPQKLRFYPGRIYASSKCLKYTARAIADLCYEVGVVLEGRIAKEMGYIDLKTCDIACKELEGCTGFSGLGDLLKCYLYSGPVYKTPYPLAISSAYSCNKDFALVPSDDDMLIRPVSYLLDLSTSFFNMNMEINSDMRTLTAYNSIEEVLFTMDFYMNKQYADWDLRLSGCPEGFNFSSQPCAHETGPTRKYLVQITTVFMNVYCGTTDIQLFMNVPDVSVCSINATGWDGFKLTGFTKGDLFSLHAPDADEEEEEESGGGEVVIGVTAITPTEGTATPASSSGMRK